jgi:hypothetical protein
LNKIESSHTQNLVEKLDMLKKKLERNRTISPEKTLSSSNFIKIKTTSPISSPRFIIKLIQIKNTK